MDIKEMEESGVYDYYDKLNKWMNHFVNRNYPLSKEDLIALTNGETTENIINRNKVFDILKSELDKQLITQQGKNAEMLRQMEEDKIYTPYTIDDLNNDIEQMQQEMLEQLYNELHPQEQEYTGQTNLENEASVETESNQGMINQNDWKQENEEIYEGQTGEQGNEQEYTQSSEEMINQVIEQSQELEIRSDEISTANMEINQAEQNYMLEQQMQENIDMGIGIGE